MYTKEPPHYIQEVEDYFFDCIHCYTFSHAETFCKWFLFPISGGKKVSTLTIFRFIIPIVFYTNECFLLSLFSFISDVYNPTVNLSYFNQLHKKLNPVNDEISLNTTKYAIPLSKHMYMFSLLHC